MRQVLILLALAVLPTMALDLAAAGRLPAGTEIVELRAPGARHYSNGDGTLRAEFGGFEDSEDTLFSVFTGFSDVWIAIGYVLPINGPASVVLMQSVPAYWISVHGRGWAEWDIRSLPEEIEIQDVSIRVLSVGSEWPAQLGVELRELELQPRVWGNSQNGDTALALYNDCGSGLVYGLLPEPDYYGTWYSAHLNEDARNKLQAQIPAGWFGIGFNKVEPFGPIYQVGYHGIDSPRDNWPRLIVQYAGGVAEEKSLPVAGHRFTVGPNPLTGGIATLRFEGLGHIPRLTVKVYDAAGRSVLARQLTVGGRSAEIPLDLRGLSNGVYLVRIQADGFAAEQKMIIQR